LVQKTHHTLGLGDLPKRIATKDNVAAIACAPGLLPILQRTSTVFKRRIACWVASLATVVLAFTYTWWWLMALVVTVAVERYFRSSERQGLQVLAATLLSLEVLASDFAGWGAAYPAERKEAQQALAGHRTEWLDYYLPRRAQLAADVVRQFGPASLG
jgi:hypothetical protein